MTSSLGTSATFKPDVLSHLPDGPVESRTADLGSSTLPRSTAWASASSFCSTLAHVAMEGQGKAKASASRFCDLPLALQIRILALAGAPLLTCKAAAALLHDPDATTLWLAARYGNPFAAAAKYDLWDAWCACVEAGHRATNADHVAALCHACQAGQVQAVRRMLARHTRPAASTVQMAAASAARGGSWEVLQELLAHASTCNMHVDRSKLVPILAEEGHIKVLRCLLHRDGDPGLQDILLETAEQDWQAVLGLVQQQDRGLPASLLLQYAIDQLGSAGLRALLQCSAAPVGNAPATESAFIAAAQCGRLQCLQVLREHGLCSMNPAVVTAAVQGGHHRCVELLLRLIPQHVWRVDGLVTAAAHGYCRILELLLEQQDVLGPGSRLMSSQLSVAFSNAACRGHLECARLLVDRIVQAYKDDERVSEHKESIKEVNSSLAAAAKAGDWRMVELTTSRSWPDGIPETADPHPFLHRRNPAQAQDLRLAPDTSRALYALLGTSTPEVDKLLQSLLPVTRPKPQGGSAAGSSSTQKARSSSGITGASSSGSTDAESISTRISDTSSTDRKSHTELELEVDEVDEAEVPSLQQHPPSRSKAAVLMIRAGAKVWNWSHDPLLALAEKERSEELKEVLRSCGLPAQKPSG